MAISLQKLDKSDREHLVKEIEKMEIFDELSYCIDDRDYDQNYVIKLNRGFLFKAKYANDYVYIAEVDFV